MKTKIVKTGSHQETMEAAALFAKAIKPGARILLQGGLGSGKTVFVRGFLRVLGYTGRVLSPTYIYLRSYQVALNLKKLNFYHFDLYRLKSKNEAEGTGIMEILHDRKNIVAVEWPEKLNGMAITHAVLVEITWGRKVNERIIRMQS